MVVSHCLCILFLSYEIIYFVAFLFVLHLFIYEVIVWLFVHFTIFLLGGLVMRCSLLVLVCVVVTFSVGKVTCGQEISMEGITGFVGGGNLESHEMAKMRAWKEAEAKKAKVKAKAKAVAKAKAKAKAKKEAEARDRAKAKEVLAKIYFDWKKNCEKAKRDYRKADADFRKELEGAKDVPKNVIKCFVVLWERNKNITKCLDVALTGISVSASACQRQKTMSQADKTCAATRRTTRRSSSSGGGNTSISPSRNVTNHK
jgi:hypothetical protein